LIVLADALEHRISVHQALFEAGPRRAFLFELLGETGLTGRGGVERARCIGHLALERVAPGAGVGELTFERLSRGVRVGEFQGEI
jgi:hypothetical protein